MYAFLLSWRMTGCGFQSQPVDFFPTKIPEPSFPYQRQAHDVLLIKGTRSVRPGTVTTYPETIHNTGALIDTYTVTAQSPTSPRGWIDPRALPLTITLAPDQTSTISFPITVPLTASVGMEDTLAINAVNHAGIKAYDSATIRVQVE